MGKGKKLFTKENSITFRLVHRSQRDPLIADETAPSRVLVPKRRSAAASSFVSQLYGHPTGEQNKKDRKEEQLKCGIYFDDDYDYLQHVKEPGAESIEWRRVERVPKRRLDPTVEEDAKKSLTSLTLPADMFPSCKEEHEGMLAKGLLPVGPRPDWDPDIVAALDDDFDFTDPDNELADDFFEQAGGEVANQEKGLHDESDLELWEGRSQDGRMEDSDDTLTNGSESNDSDDDKKTCFTGYSLTSSVIRRNEGLQTLDDQFEALYTSQYGDETELGPLDLHTIEGYIDPNSNDRISRMVAQFKEESNKKLCDAFTADQRVVFHDKSYDSDSDSDEEKYERITIQREDEDRLDCESVLSTYSSLYNHPTLIVEPRSTKVRLDPKTGLPLERPDFRKGITSHKLAQLDSGDRAGELQSERSVSESRLSQLSIRSKDETPDERRARKAALREYRRERRVEKKLNKEAFKEEKCTIDKQVLNAQNKLKAVKLV